MSEQNNKAINLDVFHLDPNGKKTRIGVLSRIPGKKNLTYFDYLPEYTGPAIPTLPKNQGSLKFWGLPPFFRNLTPDKGWLKDAHKKVLNAHGYPQSCFYTLALYGRDISGNVSVEPQDPLFKKEVEGLDSIGSKLVDTNNALVSGKQPKFLVRKTSAETFEVSTAEERGDYIAKFIPDEADFSDFILNGHGFAGKERTTPDTSRMLIWEYVATVAYDLLLPNDKTIDVELGRVKGIDTEALLIKKFDRKPIRALYDFCQLFGLRPEKKFEASYGQIADYIRSHATSSSGDGIRTNLKDVDILFKRVLATNLIGNGDAHLKNFSLLEEGNEFRLAPNYDVTSLISYKGKDFWKRALAIGERPHAKNSSLKSEGDVRHPLKHQEARHAILLAQDMGLLSKPPTMEEQEHFLSLVEEVDAQAKQVALALKNKDASQFPNMEKLFDPRFRPEREALADYIEKRRNESLAGVRFALAKTLRNRAKPKDPTPVRTTPASSAVSTSSPGLPPPGIH